MARFAVYRFDGSRLTTIEAESLQVITDQGPPHVLFYDGNGKRCGVCFTDDGQTVVKE